MNQTTELSDELSNRDTEQVQKRYEFVQEDTIQTTEGATLTRIRALVDIPAHNVKAGELGGYIESEKNLPHEANSWVFDRAQVFDNARVLDFAAAYDSAAVCGMAVVGGRARVERRAKVCGNTLISGNAVISGCAVVSDTAFVSGHAVVGEDAQVSGDSHVIGNAIVWGAARVRDEAQVSGLATVSGKAEIGGGAILSGHLSVSGDALIQGNVVVKGHCCITGNALIAKYSDLLILNLPSGQGSTLAAYRTKEHEVVVETENAVYPWDEYENCVPPEFSDPKYCYSMHGATVSLIAASFNLAVSRTICVTADYAEELAQRVLEEVRAELRLDEKGAKP